MSIEYRNITPDEFVEWRTLVRRGFNEQVHPDDIARLRDDRAEIDRILGAFDGSEMVGTGGIDSHVMTVPGGAKVPTAGIAYIGTAATHRRRGVLTGMMKTLLKQAREREEPVAALWASESSIYGRFGYGQATIAEAWETDPTRANFIHMPEIPGRVRFIERDEAMRVMPTIWESGSQQRAGFLDRSERRWRYFFYDDKRIRGDWSGIFFVAYKVESEPHGYAAYRLRRIDPHDDPLTMQVVECVAVSDDAHAALWRFLLSVDLVQSVAADNRPSDDPLWWMLADPRRLERVANDGLWVRVLDPEKALSARTYAAEGRLVIELKDDFLPDIDGTFQLESSGGNACCERVAASPDISISMQELGATYLGGIRLADLTAAGRVTEHTDGAVRLFDRMFLADRAPWCAHEF